MKKQTNSIIKLQYESWTGETKYIDFDHSKLEYGKIEHNETIEEFLDMTNNHKGDGAYKLKFERENGKKEQIVFGYYSNGVALNRKVFCEIKNDTVLTKFSSIKY